MATLDWRRVRAISFDCYGTLIDWESGLAEALAAVLGPAARSLGRERLLALFAAHEARLERPPFRRYREVLRAALAGVGADLGVRVPPERADALAAALPGWPPFADTVAALAALARRFELGVLSNVDDDLFAATRARLGVEFRWVVTAEQVGAYKPSRRNFERLLEVTGLPPSAIVHAAQSRYHDVAPARELGLRTVWVDRRGGRPGGATPVAEATPDLVVGDLAALARMALA